MKIEYNTYNFLKLFYPIEKGNYRLTEQAVYNSLKHDEEMVPLWGGQQSHDNQIQFVSTKGKTLDNKPVKIFEGDCIIISLDGSAGSMTYKPKYEKNKKIKFALNHHAGVLRGRDETLINIEYFKYRYENLFKAISVSEGSKTLTVGSLYKNSFDIPTLKMQNEILKRYKKLMDLRTTLQTYLDIFNRVKEKTIECKSIENITDMIPINNILDYISRNDSLSLEGIYYNSPKNLEEDCISVLSGSVQNIYYGKIRASTPKIHILKNRQALHIVTRGRAGQLTYIPKGDYATNTNAFLLFIKEESLPLLDIENEEQEAIYLKYLKIYLEPIFLDISSKSDVSVFPLTEVFKKFEIPHFKYSEELAKIVKTFDKLEQTQKILESFLVNIDQIFSKEVILD